MQKTILLVDDDPVQLKLTRVLLSQAGFAVRTATGGTDALAEARRSQPDAIVSDVLMRDFDGFHLCRQLRTDATTASIPVVLVSAHFSGERDRSLAAAVGANALAERTPDFTRELQALKHVLDSGEKAPAGSLDAPGLYAERVSGQLTELLGKARVAELRYRALLEAANDGISVLNPKGRILEVNRRMTELMGLPREQIVGRHFSEFSAPGEAEINERRFGEGMVGKTLPPVTVRRGDGTPIVLQISMSSTEVDGQQLVLVISRDVTAENESARKLAASEEKYRRLVENLVDVAWSSRLSDGQMLMVTQNVVALSGFTADEVVAAGPHFWADRVHPEDAKLVADSRSRLRTDGIMDVEYRWQHKDGSWRWFRAHARASELDGTATIEGLISDVSSRKRLEAEMRQAQKMEALGMLTGGVAHDFNNLLCVILANSEMLMRSFDENDPRREDIGYVREAGERAAALTRQLLAFSRKQVLQPKLVDLGTVVKGVDKLLRRVIGEDIALELAAAETPSMVLADTSQLEQVLMNLSVNARDAMPEGGTLKLETRNVELAAGAVDGLAAGPYVQLTVTDSGCGMDAQTQAQIFEPFFTTKPAGQGTGMGLSTCYGIVAQSGGHIGVTSAPGQGATFTVLLPQASGDATSADARPKGAVRGGHETVLIVEDDEPLSRTLSRMLTRLGYTVLTARNGEEAEVLYRQHRGQISLVLSDLVMPGKSGIETVRQLRSDSFDGKVLFMSGYADRPEMHAELSKAGANFIHKPFQRDALAQRVRDALDGRPS